MSSHAFTRRCFSHAWTSVCSGLTVAWLAPRRARAAPFQASTPGAVKRLGYGGEPATGPIAPAVVHNGLIYISGQGANDNGSTDEPEITNHVRSAMDNVKQLVEAAGGDMDHVLELTVFLSTLEFYQAMNKAYAPYFPNRPPARCTVSVAGLPGHSLVEVSCIAAVVRA